jgi:hypothetical protein
MVLLVSEVVQLPARMPHPDLDGPVWLLRGAHVAHRDLRSPGLAGPTAHLVGQISALEVTDLGGTLKVVANKTMFCGQAWGP